MNLDRDPETNRAIETFAIVSCGSRKADEKCPAQDLYTSTHFQLKRRWAELYCDGWLILSAEHGIVRPRKNLEPYDTSTRDLDEDELEAWVADVKQNLWYRTHSYEGTPSGNEMAWDELPENFEPNFEIVLLAGAAYADPLEDFFENDLPVPVYRPLEGMRIGVQNQWLKTWAEAHPSVDDVTEETAVAIDYNHGSPADTDGANIYYARHQSGQIMAISRDRGNGWTAEVKNETPEEGVLNSPATALRKHRCWTVSVGELPDVDDVEWESEPSLEDFTGGASA